MRTCGRPLLGLPKGQPGAFWHPTYPSHYIQRGRKVSRRRINMIQFAAAGGLAWLTPGVSGPFWGHAGTTPVLPAAHGTPKGGPTRCLLFSPIPRVDGHSLCLLPLPQGDPPSLRGAWRFGPASTVSRPPTAVCGSARLRLVRGSRTSRFRRFWHGEMRPRDPCFRGSTG